MRLPLFAALSLFAFTADAQTPPPQEQQLSPKAAYDQALHPLDLTRSSFSNWSDTEIAALKVSVAEAAKGCAARDSKEFSGPDLIDLAHLCALGQTYPAVIIATRLYIAADVPKPLLAQAYASLIDAQLHTKDEPGVLASCKAMLAAVPYDATTAASFDQAITYMRFVYTTDALTLAVARQPLILAALQTQPATNPQAIHDLYADGLDLAVLQQLLRAAPADVATTVSDLDTHLPSTLSSDDAIPIAASRRRYALLGQPLPNLAHPTRPTIPKHPVTPASLSVPPMLPQIPAVNAITALLLFPDWCAQCIRMTLKLPTTVFMVAKHDAYMYALLAPTVPPNPAPAKPGPPGAPFDPANAVNILQDTPTVVVDPSLLTQFDAADVPLLILTDTEGIIRVLQPVGDDAAKPGDTIDSAIARVGDSFPSPLLRPKTTPPAASH